MKFLEPLTTHLGRKPKRLLLSQLADLSQWQPLLDSADESCVLHRRRSVTLGLARQSADTDIRCLAFPKHARWDVALLELPQGRDLARAMMYKTLESLDPDGLLYVWGDNRVGMRPAEEDISAVAEVTHVASGGGERLFCVKRPDIMRSAPTEWARPWEQRPLTLSVGEETLTVMTQPGVFSWEHLDEGSAFLLGYLANHPSELGLEPPGSLLDACCGYGVLGAMAARQLGAGEVVFADDDILAVNCAKHAAAQGRGEAVLADLTQEDAPGVFDLVVCNPPFHQGLSEDRTFVKKFVTRLGEELLTSEGAVLLVANKFLPYKADLAAAIGETRTMAENERWQLLLAQKG